MLAVDHGNDGRLQPDLGRPGIEDHRDPIAEVGRHMTGRSRADVAGPVGARRRDRLVESGEQGTGDGVGRNTNSDRFKPGRRQVGDRCRRAFRQDEGQGPWPESFGEAPRLAWKVRQIFSRLNRKCVDNQRIEARSCLGAVDSRDGLATGGVRGKAVYRFGRHADQRSVSERGGGGGDPGVETVGIAHVKEFGQSRHSKTVLMKVAGLSPFGPHPVKPGTLEDEWPFRRRSPISCSR